MWKHDKFNQFSLTEKAKSAVFTEMCHINHTKLPTV